jgi:hypothetical protein
VNEKCLGHQHIFSNHKTHTMYHILDIVMFILDVSIYPLCLTIWIILSTRIIFFLRYVICLILSCLSMMCSFILHVQCCIMSCSFGLRPPSDVSYALYCHVYLCVLYCWHDNLKHIAQRIGGRIPNWQDKQNRTHKIKDHIPGEHDNIKLMTNQMKSEWTRQIK